MQHHVELILMKQVASYLDVPAFLVDPDGTLLYFNVPAEALLGQRFEESGPLAVTEWGALFSPTDRDGNAINLEDLPLVQAPARGRPAHGSFWIKGLDGEARHLAVTAFPLVSESGDRLGSAALFWEEDPP